MAVANAADELQVGALAVCSDHELEHLQAVVVGIDHDDEGAVGGDCNAPWTIKFAVSMTKLAAKLADHLPCAHVGDLHTVASH